MQKKVKEIPQHAELITLLILPSENARLEWMDKHEVRYKGEMFDVVRIEKDDAGRTKITCFKDKKEDSILSSLNKWIMANHDGKGGKSENKLIKAMAKNYFPVSEIILFDNTSAELIFSGIFPNQLDPYTSIVSPPPRSLS